MVTMHECHICDKEGADLYFCSGCQQHFCSVCNNNKNGDGQPDHDPRIHADLTYSSGRASGELLTEAEGAEILAGAPAGIWPGAYDFVDKPT